ncbi:MAG: flippase [Chloroflexi bacterium]|nr:flippase [Chloroflexota bacterium]
MTRATIRAGGRVAAREQPRAHPRHSLRQNALAMVIGQTITWTLTAITLALLPRYLGPAYMGALGISLSFSGLGTTVAGVGMATLVTREIARDRAAGRELLATATWLHLGFGFVAALVSIAIGLALGYAPMTQWAIAANGIAIPFNLLTLLGFAALQGAEVMRYQALYDALNKLLFLAGTALVIAFDLGFGAYLGLSILSAVFVALPAMILMRRVLPFRPFSFSPAKARHLIVASLPFSTASIFVIVYLAVDTLLLSLLSGETAVGIYTAPSRIFGTLLFAPTIVTTVVFPRMAASSRAAPDQLRKLASTTLQLVIGVTLPVTILTLGVGDEGLVWLVGHGFADSGPVVLVLALSLVPTSVNMVAHRILIAVDRQRVWTIVIMAALAVKVALGLALIPLFARWFGNAALGAATSLLAVEAAMMLAAAYFMPRGILDRAACRLYSRLAGAAIIAGAAMFATRPLGFIVIGAAGALAYAAVALLLHAYDVRRLLSGVRWASGREALPALPSIPAAVVPLVFAPQRLKGIRPAGTRRAG